MLKHELHSPRTHRLLMLLFCALPESCLETATNESRVAKSRVATTFNRARQVLINVAVRYAGTH